MILQVSLLLLHVNGLMAGLTNPKPTIDIKQKPFMCKYIEPTLFYGDINPKLNAECIPQVCEAVLFDSVMLGNDSAIYVNEKDLINLVKLKPVIVVISRLYRDWGSVLKSGAKDKDANLLIKFAKSHNISGYVFGNINPQPYLRDVLNVEVTKNIVPYLQKVKYSPEFIVGVVIGSYGTQIRNPCITDFAALNSVVDFYSIDTTLMNSCNKDKPTNDASPVKFVPHGNDYLYSMEEVTNFLKASKCDLEKVFLNAEVYPQNGAGYHIYDSYYTVCTTKNLCAWCIPHTNDYFNKGQYIKQQQFGLIVNSLNCDDLKNACGCGTFIATQNIWAGYRGKNATPCSKIDSIKVCPIKP